MNKPKVNYLRSKLKPIICFIFVLCIMTMSAVIRSEVDDGGIYQVRKTFSKIPPFSYLINERDQTKSVAYNITLNFAAPSFEDLISIALSDDVAYVRGKNLEQYMKYYQKVIRYFPDLAEAHGIIGFCYFYEHKYDMAIASFIRAAQLKPDFFWFHYNLGVVHFKNKHYKTAANEFNRAININKNSTLNNVLSSGIYRQMFYPNGNIRNYPAQGKINSAYRESYMLLALSLKRSGQGELAQGVMGKAKSLFDIQTNIIVNEGEIGPKIF